MASDFNSLAAELDRSASNLQSLTERATRTLGMEGLAKVKSNASGRPGPRRVTGDYTRTMNARVSTGGGDTEAEIATNAAQALRLEHGFFGADRLGRRYNQPPYPHWRPAFEWLTPRAEAAIRQAVKDAVG